MHEMRNQVAENIQQGKQSNRSMEQTSGGAMNQLSMFDDAGISTERRERNNAKRRWENAFQKWSNNHGMFGDPTESYGCCGYGSMCDWCDDNTYGRPCVRALNAMCREKNIQIDYSDRDFEKIWCM